MNWLRRLYRLSRWVFRGEPSHLPKEVEARVRLFETERRVRMARYVATWRRKWTEQGIVLDGRSRFRRAR